MARGAADPVPERRVVRHVAHRGPLGSDPARRDRRALARPAEALEAGQLLPSGDPRRGAHLRARDQVHRAPSPGAGRAARHVQPASQLPLRARGGVRRDLRFAGAAARSALQGHSGASRDLDDRGGIPARRRLVADLPRRAPSHRRCRWSADGSRRNLCRALRSAHGPQGRGAAPREARRAARASRGTPA